MSEPKGSGDLIQDMIDAYELAPGVLQIVAMEAAAKLLLDRFRSADPCDIVIDGAGKVCARHDRSPGECPIDAFARANGLGT